MGIDVWDGPPPEEEEPEEAEKTEETPETEEEVPEKDAETPEEAETEGEEPAEAEEEGETPEEGAEEDDSPGKEVVTLRVDGKDVEKTVEEVIEIAQKNLAADVRLEKAALERKEAEKARQELEAEKVKLEEVQQASAVIDEQLIIDPIEMARHLLVKEGHSQDAVFKHYWPYVKATYENMKHLSENPDAYNNYILASENQQLKSAKELEAKQREEQEAAQTLQQHQEALETGIMESLKAAGLDATEEEQNRVGQIMIAAAEANRDLTPQEAVDSLKDEFQAKRARDREALLKDLKPEDLERINPELTKKFQAYSVEKAKARQQKAQATKPRKKKASATQREKPKSKSWNEVFPDPLDIDLT